jgi:hypothetical protein
MSITVISSILDFPRKTLSEDIWQYQNSDKINELPIIKPVLKNLLLSTINTHLSRLNLTLSASNIYGGAASYQWAPHADIDVSVYAEGWSKDIKDKNIEIYQEYFKKLEVPFKDYVIHFFLKLPHETVLEVADAVYDIINDEWIMPPLVLPKHFDPEVYFKPFLKVAEDKAKKFDVKIGDLRRVWSIMSKASEAKKDAVEPQLVQERINKEKDDIRAIVKWLSDNFVSIRDKRYAMHDKLREKIKKDIEVGRFERFQEPEIIWKYLDRAGYNDFLHKMYKLHSDNKLEKILSTY